MSLSDRPTGRAAEDSQLSLVNTDGTTIWGADGVVTRTVAGSSVPRLGRRGLGALERQLTGRDRAVLRTVADFRFLTAVQIERLHFTADGTTSRTTARAARRTLERLAQQRVLDRLQRRIGGVRAGSASFIYRVGPVGRRLLADERQARRGREPSPALLLHSLATAEVFIAAMVAARLAEPEITVVDYQPEPRCWRLLPGSGGGDQLRPDLYLVIAGRETEWHWFIEVDLGTEHAPALRRKCRQYQAYYQSGIEQSRRGVFPRVAWLTTTAERARRIERTISADKGLQAGLFVVGLISGTATVLLPKGPA